MEAEYLRLAQVEAWVSTKYGNQTQRLQSAITLRAAQSCRCAREMLEAQESNSTLTVSDTSCICR